MEVVQPLDDNAGSAKRRKVGNGELRLPSSKPVRITGCDNDDVINTSKSLSDSVDKEDIPASCCSVDADLEETAETKAIITVRCNLSTKESFPLQQLKTHTHSPMAEKQPLLTSFRRRVPMTPPAAELEEFFAAAEIDLQNRFKDKYNYDFVKDVPLKGRFEWIQLKQ